MLTPLWFHSSVSRPACPVGWTRHGKSCFLIINIPTLKWSDARRTCQNLGRDLPTIRTSEENNFIFGLLKKQKAITDWGVWLGFTRKSDDKFYWIDNTPLEGHYSPWASGEPDNSNDNEHCGNMFGGEVSGGKWNDLWCSLKESQLKYAPSTLCQKQSDWTNDAALYFTVELYQSQTWLCWKASVQPLSIVGQVISLIDHNPFFFLFFLLKLYCAGDVKLK